MTFLDSTGIGVILALSRACTESGQELGLIPGQHQLQRVLALRGAEALLPFAGPGG